MSEITNSLEEPGQATRAPRPVGGLDKPILAGRGLGVLATAILSAAVSAAVAVAALCVYDLRYAQKVIAFDLPGYVEAVRREVGRGAMTEEQMAASLAQVDRLLSGVSANHVVLSRDVVLRNARELPLPTIGPGTPASTEQPLLSPRATYPGAQVPGLAGNGP